MQNLLLALGLLRARLGPLGAEGEMAPEVVARHDVTVPLGVQKGIPENLLLNLEMSLRLKQNCLLMSKIQQQDVTL